MKHANAFTAVGLGSVSYCLYSIVDYIFGSDYNTLVKELNEATKEIDAQTERQQEMQEIQGTESDES